jgi:CRISPR system Cascade subunit CasE
VIAQMFQATFPYPGPLDPEAVHRWVEKLMGGRAANHYIYAAEQASPIYTAISVRTAVVPPPLKDLATPVPAFNPGEALYFSLTATAEKRVGSGPRQPLPPGDLAARRAWLDRRAEMHGFVVTEATTTTLPPLRIRKEDGGRPFALDRTRFTGLLTVADRDAFATTLLNGVGRGRAYGNGFLFVDPVEPRRTT